HSGSTRNISLHASNPRPVPAHWLPAAGLGESSPCAVADVQHLNPPLPFQHPIDYTIDVGLVAVQQMSKFVIFWGHRTPDRLFPEAQYGFLEALVPIERGFRIPGIDARIEVGKVTPCAVSDVNEIGHVWLQTRQETSPPDASFPCLRPPIPA